MTESLYVDDTIIYQEMLTHPPLFSHRMPEKILVHGDANHRLLEEIIKHQSLNEIWEITEYPSAEPLLDSKIIYHSQLPALPSSYFDIIIVTEKPQDNLFGPYLEALKSEGILLQLSDSPFNVANLRDIQINLQLAGFRDVHIISFPQPSFDTGWRSALMAKKNGIFTRLREKAIFNKNFSTRYYNLDVHKAALVLPEFMREALTI